MIGERTHQYRSLATLAVVLSACGGASSRGHDAAVVGAPIAVGGAGQFAGSQIDGAMLTATFDDAARRGAMKAAVSTPRAPDAGASGAEPEDSGSAGSACTISVGSARCDSQPVQKIGATADMRRVYWAQPTEPAPPSGYPTVILYQGSFIGPSATWDVDMAKSAAFGGYYQVALVARLLEQGFLVIQPEAQGGQFWSTNVALDYATSADGVFIPMLLSALKNGIFGHVDQSRLYATGISSGGYMTSRMAVSYPGRFRALAIESASYATCAGPVCNVPSRLPAGHPPTLMLHGDADSIVPVATAKDYHDKLLSNGIETSFIEDAQAGHQWLSSAPDAVVSWFLAH